MHTLLLNTFFPDFSRIPFNSTNLNVLGMRKHANLLVSLTLGSYILCIVLMILSGAFLWAGLPLPTSIFAGAGLLALVAASYGLYAMNKARQQALTNPLPPEIIAKL